LRRRVQRSIPLWARRAEGAAAGGGIRPTRWARSRVYQDSSFGIPAIYLNDWPDAYIHTNFDTASNIDPTKLKEGGVYRAASGYFLAGFSQAGCLLSSVCWSKNHSETANKSSASAKQVESCYGGSCSRFPQSYVRPLAWSVSRFDVPTDATLPTLARMDRTSTELGGMCGYVMAAVVLRTSTEEIRSPKGPLAVFGL